MISIHKSLIAFDGHGVYDYWAGRLEERTYLDEDLEERERIPRRIIIVDRGDDISKITSPRRENTYNTIRQNHNAWFHSRDNLNII